MREEDVQWLVLVRGLPGSGKSTWAKKFAEEHGFEHFENDMYFMHDGKYEYNPDEIKTAMNWCYTEAYHALAQGKNVVVSNVFVTRKAVKRWEDLAKKVGCEFRIYRKDKNYGNVHDVPKNVLASMKRAFQDIPGEICIDQQSS